VGETSPTSLNQKLHSHPRGECIVTNPTFAVEAQATGNLTG